MDRRSLLGWALVCLQFALIAALLLLPRRQDWPVPLFLEVIAWTAVVVGVLGAGLAALALGPSLTPTPQPRRDAQLRTDGPYRWVRHPIYGGLLVAASGWALRSGSWLTVGLAGVFVLFLSAKARWEEHLLTERFPEYPERFRDVPRFLPVPGRSGPHPEAGDGSV